MAATKQRRKTNRQFVVRLEQPGLYDRLLRESLRRSKMEGRRIAMTEITREALIEYLNRLGAPGAPPA